VISAKRPKLSASRPVVNGNGLSLTDLLKPTATGDRPKRPPYLRLDRLSRSTLRFAVKPAYAFVPWSVPLPRGGVAGDEVVGTIGFRIESVFQGPEMVRGPVARMCGDPPPRFRYQRFSASGRATLVQPRGQRPLGHIAVSRRGPAIAWFFCTRIG
jgi:hypothetical protein